MKLSQFARALGAAMLVAAPGLSQGCPQGAVVLTVTPSATNLMLGVSVTGTPGAMVVLFRGPNLGQTTLSGSPLSGTVICLASPFAAMQLGPIPPGGTKMVALPSPSVPPGATVNFQAVTIAATTGGMPPLIDTSNTANWTHPTPPPPPPCNPGSVQLVITPDVAVQPGNTVTVSVTGTAGAHVVLVKSHALGSTPVGVLSSPLCLASPLVTDHIGMIPASGTLTLTHNVPPNAMLPGNVTIWFQAVTVVMAPTGSTPTFDTSNTDFLML